MTASGVRGRNTDSQYRQNRDKGSLRRSWMLNEASFPRVEEPLRQPMLFDRVSVKASTAIGRLESKEMRIALPSAETVFPGHPLEAYDLQATNKPARHISILPKSLFSLRLSTALSKRESSAAP